MKEIYTVVYSEIIEIYNESGGTSFNEESLTYINTVFSLSFDNMEVLKNFDLNYVLNFNLYKPTILKDPDKIRSGITNEFEIDYDEGYNEICNIIKEDLCNHFGPIIATDFKTEKETNPKFVSDMLKFVTIRDASELSKAYKDEKITILRKSYELHRDYLYDEMIYIDIELRCCIVSSPIFTGDDNEFVEYELIKNLEV